VTGLVDAIFGCVDGLLQRALAVSAPLVSCIDVDRSRYAQWRAAYGQHQNCGERRTAEGIKLRAFRLTPGLLGSGPVFRVGGVFASAE
jgi:hypothetical protein